MCIRYNVILRVDCMQYIQNCLSVLDKISQREHCDVMLHLWNEPNFEVCPLTGRQLVLLHGFECDLGIIA